MHGTTTSFPETFRDIPTDRLLHSYRTAPARLRAAVAGLTRHQVTARPIPGKWSTLEIALHVADMELMGATRIRLALAEPGREFIGFDQVAWARTLRYNEASDAELQTALTIFGALRTSLHALLTAVRDEAWTDNGACHPEYGPLTLRNLLELYADHGERHLAQIAERRRLMGVPVDVAIVLPTRLY